MKRIVVLLRPCAGAGALLLLLSIFFLGGCSNNSSGGDSGGETRAKYGLEPSEFVALKKASKNPTDRKNALIKQRVKQLQDAGVVVETTPSGQKTKKRR